MAANVEYPNGLNLNDSLEDYEVPESIVSAIRQDGSQFPTPYYPIAVVNQPRSTSHFRRTKGISGQFAEIRDAVALVDRTPTDADELAFRKGEELHVVVIRTKLYWDALSKETGKTGVVNENDISLLPLREKNKEDTTSLQNGSPDTSGLESLYMYAKPWFKGKISQEETADILSSEKAPGTFLIREIENPVCFYLGVRHDNYSCKHFDIKKNNAQQFYIYPEATFSSLEDLISYYLGNKNGLGCQLTTPCEVSVNELESDERIHQESETSQPEYLEVRQASSDESADEFPNLSLEDPKISDGQSKENGIILENEVYEPYDSKGVTDPWDDPEYRSNDDNEPIYEFYDDADRDSVYEECDYAETKPVEADIGSKNDDLSAIQGTPASQENLMEDSLYVDSMINEIQENTTDLDKGLLIQDFGNDTIGDNDTKAAEKYLDEDSSVYIDYSMDGGKFEEEDTKGSVELFTEDKYADNTSNNEVSKVFKEFPTEDSSIYTDYSFDGEQLRDNDSTRQDILLLNDSYMDHSKNKEDTNVPEEYLTEDMSVYTDFELNDEKPKVPEEYLKPSKQEISRGQDTLLSLNESSINENTDISFFTDVRNDGLHTDRMALKNETLEKEVTVVSEEYDPLAGGESVKATNEYLTMSHNVDLNKSNGERDSDMPEEYEMLEKKIYVEPMEFELLDNEDTDEYSKSAIQNALEEYSFDIADDKPVVKLTRHNQPDPNTEKREPNRAIDEILRQTRKEVKLREKSEGANSGRNMQSRSSVAADRASMIEKRVREILERSKSLNLEDNIQQADPFGSQKDESSKQSDSEEESMA